MLSASEKLHTGRPFLTMRRSRPHGERGGDSKIGARTEVALYDVANERSDISSQRSEPCELLVVVDAGVF